MSQRDPFQISKRRMSFVDITPPEIISRIFQHCSSFKAVVSLASTCKHAHNIWVSETSSIAFEVGKTTVVAFEHALLAIRVTSTVVEAHKQGQQPPLIILSEINNKTQMPTLTELKKALGISKLVSCIDHLFMLNFAPTNQFEGFKRSDTWTVHFHQAIYRVLIAGAYFSHHYQAPFFSAIQHGPKNFLDDFFRTLGEDRSLGITGVHGGVFMPDPDVQFLRTFPVYDFGNYEASESTFAPFVDWFLTDVRRSINSKSSNETNSHGTSVEDMILREVGRFLFAFIQLAGRDRQMYFRHNAGMFEFMATGYERELNSREQPHSVDIVLFGVFQWEMIGMPKVVKDADRTFLLARQAPKHENAPKITDIPALLQQLFTQPDRPNQRDDDPAPAPPLQLVSCILQRGFGQRFGSDIFEIGFVHQPYSRFERNGNIFGDSEMEDFFQLLDDAGEPFVQSWGEVD